jgi:hypothetical protein
VSRTRQREQEIGLKLERPLSDEEASQLLGVAGVRSILHGASGPQFPEVRVAARSFYEASVKATALVQEAIDVATVEAYRTKPRLSARAWSLFSGGVAVGVFFVVFFGAVVVWRAVGLPPPPDVVWPVLFVVLLFVGWLIRPRPQRPAPAADLRRRLARQRRAAYLSRGT